MNHSKETPFSNAKQLLLGHLIDPFALSLIPQITAGQMLRIIEADDRAQALQRFPSLYADYYYATLVARKERSTARKFGVTISLFSDSSYPETLRSLKTPPLHLYYKGPDRLLPPPTHLFALVGDRKSNPNTQELAQKLGYQIARSGGSLVTYITRGINTQAATGAFSGGSAAILVLPSSIDQARIPDTLSKKRNAFLVSEYPFGTKQTPDSIKHATRIVAALPQTVVLLGSINTPNPLRVGYTALELGKTVFLLSGTNEPTPSPNQRLLLHRGATLVKNTHQIINHLAATISNKQYVQVSAG